MDLCDAGIFELVGAPGETGPGEDSDPPDCEEGGAGHIIGGVGGWVRSNLHGGSKPTYTHTLAHTRAPLLKNFSLSIRFALAPVEDDDEDDSLL